MYSGNLAEANTARASLHRLPDDLSYADTSGNGPAFLSQAAIARPLRKYQSAAPAAPVAPRAARPETK